MKTKILSFSALFSLILLGLTATSVSSCKEDKTCHGDVTVYDSTGKLLSGASVKLFHPGDTSASYTSKPGNIVYNATTGSSGNVKFEIKLPAVYTVRADHPTIADKYILGVLILNEPGSKDSEILTFK